MPSRGAKVDRAEYLHMPALYAVRGSALPHAKLSDEKVSEIRKRYKRHSLSDGAAAIARELGLHHNTVLRVVSYANWTHVP